MSQSGTPSTRMVAVALLACAACENSSNAPPPRTAPVTSDGSAAQVAQVGTEPRTGSPTADAPGFPGATNGGVPAATPTSKTTAADKVGIEDVVVGTGAEAKLGDTVRVHYTGSLVTGKIFDASRDHDEKGLEFGLGQGQVIKGWDDGVTGMKVGGKRKLTVPSQLGYGPRGMPPTIPPNATLLFDVELLEVHTGTTKVIKDPNKAEKISARHVLVQYMGAERASTQILRSREQARTIAEEVLRRAKSGQDLGRLAMEYSDEPGASSRGGSLGRFGRGQMVPAFEAAAFALKVGEISDIVETPFGFHVIQRIE